MNDKPARPMYARRNDDGVSVNESALCAPCTWDDDAQEASLLNWQDAEDVNAETADDGLYPVDNPDAICNGCGATVPDNQPAPDADLTKED